MQKLNELVELAKKATPGRNHDRLDSCGGGIKYQCLGDDGSLVLQCDHKNDKYGFIGPKSLEDEAFFLACKPETILAIAAEFRVLEQRAEAAEAEVQRLNATAQPVSDGWVSVPRSLTAENGAKAALLGEFSVKQNIVCHECLGEGCDDCNGQGHWISSIPVDWTTIKEIWAKGVEHFSPAAPGGQDD